MLLCFVDKEELVIGKSAIWRGSGCYKAPDVSTLREKLVKIGPTVERLERSLVMVKIT